MKASLLEKETILDFNSQQSGKQRVTYSVEDAFDQIDKPFVAFYGEYGRRIVNARREEWNKTDKWNFKAF